MAKYYSTNDVAKFFNDYLDDLLRQAEADTELTGLALGSFVERVRILRAFVNEVIENMRTDDIAYEEKMTAWRLEQAEKEAKDGTTT
jgi:hypothetical protein